MRIIGNGRLRCLVKCPRDKHTNPQEYGERSPRTHRAYTDVEYHRHSETVQQATNEPEYARQYQNVESVVCSHLSPPIAFRKSASIPASAISPPGI